MEKGGTVDRGAARNAAAGDMEPAAGVARGSRGDTAIKHGHGIIAIQDDATTDFAAGYDVFCHGDCLFDLRLDRRHVFVVQIRIITHRSEHS